ncbi:MAG TPA: tRNA guanosine(34) transglycosylase Tgt [Acidimicrobiales bacterium]|nr:tRNA guanosine(34) transglycosylase Tgt [Acidimicrobiales bacterium]
MLAAPIELEVVARDGHARATLATTPRGQIRTPCFMPVGTRAAVKHLTADDLTELGVQVVLANTYHLMLRPGAEVVSSLGGLHRFMGFDGHVLTDSGGFQVFSLSPQVDDDGVTFRSVYDGSTQRLTPESAVAIQEALGADIQMALDVCPPLPSPPDVVRLAMERTAAWAERAAAVHRREGQALFGIVQGGTDLALRGESARRAAEIGFAGYGIGGLSVGETREEMLPALSAATAELPSDRLRYLMGVGDPLSLVEAVALGVDLFDCVLPSRLGRHGTLLTDEGRINLRNARFARDDDPIDASAPSPVSARFSRGYVRHLLTTDEPTGRRLLTLHNVGWLLRFVERMRASIESGSFTAFRAAVSSTWDR